MKFKIQNSKFKINNGFTLIELIVAMSLFIILIAVIVGGFVNALRYQRAAVALMTANDNIGLTIEQISREIRTGYNFCKIGSDKFQFVNAKNEVIRIKFMNDGIGRGVSTQTGSASANDFCSNIMEDWFNYKKITADNVKINEFNVKICGENIDNTISLDSCGSGGKNFPPRITLGFSITSLEPDVAKLNLSTNIQTTISSRNFKS